MFVDMRSILTCKHESINRRLPKLSKMGIRGYTNAFKWCFVGVGGRLYMLRLDSLWTPMNTADAKVVAISIISL